MPSLERPHVDSTLTLKLVLVPTLIGAASLAGRRFGPAVSGPLVALPVYRIQAGYRLSSRFIVRRVRLPPSASIT
jgi:hypothetical protein